MLQVVGGEKQDSGVRIQESEVRSQKEKHLLPAFCLLPPAYCRLPTAIELAGLSPRSPVCDKMSPPMGKERANDFRKRRNYAGMSMKTKDEPSTDGWIPRML
jgi:hypothetical protein